MRKLSLREKEVLKAYRSPKPKDKNFTTYWRKFLPRVAFKNNFNAIHRKNLEILCDLYCEYDWLTQIVNSDPMLYRAFETEGRNGIQIKTHPFVVQKKDVQNQISAYTKLLNIKIDEKEEDPSDPEVEEWTKDNV